ncbi:MAG: serine/threonine-protein kinase [Planctomycetota bacterium]
MRRYADPDPTDETLPPREANAPAPAAEPRAGDVVDKYHLEAEIGRGAMGAVFRARAADTGRDVAVKVISGAYAGIQEAHARFEREARAAARTAGHPGIAGVHDLGEVNGLPYLVMELVEGPTLQECLDAERYDDRELVQRIVEAARAVHHAHGQGVLHRDLKPGNILVAEDGTVRVTDFGLASMALSGADLTRLTAEGRAVGTPAFMPPEQARAGSCDARSDVYSLGATLFHCLAGRAPIAEGTVPEMVQRVVDGARMPLLQARPDVPPELAAVVERALATQPAGRYPTAAAFADDLERWLAGTAVEAGTAHAPPKPPTPVAVWWLAGAGAAAVLVAWGVWWFTADSLRGATEVARAREATEAVQRSTADHEALAALALQTAGPLAVLEDRYHEAPVTDAEAAAALEAIRRSAEGVGGPSAQAWVHFATWLIEDADGAGRLDGLEAGARDPGGTLARSLLVRACALRYARLMKTPAFTMSMVRASARPLEDTHERRDARAALEAALAGLQADADTAVAPAMRALADGAAAFAAGDYGRAEGLLQPIQDDPLTGAEALLFRGFALHLAQEFGRAAQMFEPLAARGWSIAQRMAGRSWTFHAINTMAAQKDPAFALERAERSLAAWMALRPEDSDVHYFSGAVDEARGMDARRRRESIVAHYTRALDHYTKATTLSRHPAHAHLGVARVAITLGRHHHTAAGDPATALPLFQRGWNSCVAMRELQVPVWLYFSADMALELAMTEEALGRDSRARAAEARALWEAQVRRKPTAEAHGGGRLQDGTGHQLRGARERAARRGGRARGHHGGRRLVRSGGGARPGVRESVGHGGTRQHALGPGTGPPRRSSRGDQRLRAGHGGPHGGGRPLPQPPHRLLVEPGGLPSQRRQGARETGRRPPAELRGGTDRSRRRAGTAPHPRSGVDPQGDGALRAVAVARIARGGGPPARRARGGDPGAGARNRAQPRQEREVPARRGHLAPDTRRALTDAATPRRVPRVAPAAARTPATRPVRRSAAHGSRDAAPPVMPRSAPARCAR